MPSRAMLLVLISLVLWLGATVRALPLNPRQDFPPDTISYVNVPELLAAIESANAAPAEFPVSIPPPVPIPTSVPTPAPAIGYIKWPCVRHSKGHCVATRGIVTERQPERIEARLENLNPTTDVGIAALNVLQSLVNKADALLNTRKISGAQVPSFKQKRETADEGPTELVHTPPELLTVIGPVESADTNRNFDPAQHPNSRVDAADMPSSSSSSSFFSRLLRYVDGVVSFEGNEEQIQVQSNDKNTDAWSGYTVEIKKFARRALARRKARIEEDLRIEIPRGGWRRAVDAKALGPHGTWRRTPGTGNNNAEKRQDARNACTEVVADANILGIKDNANVCLGGNVVSDKVVKRALGEDNILERQTLVKRPIIRNGNRRARSVGDGESAKYLTKRPEIKGSTD